MVSLQAPASSPRWRLDEVGARPGRSTEETSSTQSARPRDTSHPFLFLLIHGNKKTWRSSPGESPSATLITVISQFNEIIESHLELYCRRAVALRKRREETFIGPEARVINDSMPRSDKRYVQFLNGSERFEWHLVRGVLAKRFLSTFCNAFANDRTVHTVNMSRWSSSLRMNLALVRGVSCVNLNTPYIRLTLILLVVLPLTV